MLTRLWRGLAARGFARARARKAAASLRGPRQAAGLGSQGGFAARGFAATHGRGHVPTTINIEIAVIL